MRFLLEGLRRVVALPRSFAADAAAGHEMNQGNGRCACGSAPGSDSLDADQAPVPAIGDRSAIGSSPSFALTVMRGDATAAKAGWAAIDWRRASL
jgi:hypothetical protein